MNWLNLRVSDLRAPEFLGAEPIARATWLAVLAFCVDQENSGRIVGGARWTNRQWQAVCGVTADEVSAAGSLLITDGDDVLVWNYPAEKEIEVRAKREQARTAAIRRWSAAEKADTMRPQCVAHASRMHLCNAEVEVERKEKGKSVAGANGREGCHPAPPPTDLPDFDSARAPASPLAREQADESDSVWLERLAREWPRLEIAVEIDAARRKHPTGFDRPWFERKWLPHSKPRIAAAPRPAGASLVMPPALPEPEGWRAEIEGTNYAPGGAYPVDSWAELPPDLKKLIAERLRARPAVHG